MAALPATHIVNRRGSKFEEKKLENLTDGTWGELAAIETIITGKK